MESNLKNLIESYYSIYEETEEISEEEKSLRTDNPCWKGYHPVGTKKKNGRTVPNCVPKEEVDNFDTVLEYLVSEGYADTNESALVIMSNMSQEWREEILEGMTMKDFKERRRKLQRKEASDDAKKRGHVDKFTGKTYSTAEAASRRKNIHSPEKAPEREARRKFAEDPN